MDELEKSLEELSEQRLKHPVLPSYQTGVKNVDLLATVKKLEEVVAEGKPFQVWVVMMMNTIDVML